MRKTRKTRNDQVYEEAALWVVDVREGSMDAEAREQLDAWFRRSPEHIRAYLQISCLREELEELDLERGKSLEVLIAEARASTNVVALESESMGVGSHQPGRLPDRLATELNVGMSKLARLLSWRSAVMASVALACSSAGIVALNLYRHTHFATSTGEQRTVHLTDGSTIELNSESRVRMRFSERERDVELVEGQALFRVAKDHTRPFVVQSAGTRVLAVGTQFDVYQKASGTQVTVVEGRVAVLPPAPQKGRAKDHTLPSPHARSSNEERLTAQLSTGGPAGEPAAVLLSAGEQVTVTDQEVSSPHRADVRTATAWAERKLVFEQTPLSEVVQEVNRYNTRKLVISDPALADFRILGIFSYSDLTSLMQFLRAQPGIDVIEAGDEIRISKR